MASVDVRSVAGEVVGKRDLPEALFGAPVNVPLMHQVVVAGAAAQRAGTHATKTRAQVAGGGRKPWRQKGTGRARQGSIRSPQWAGGGVAHGPVPRDHSVRVNKKMRAAALRSALTDAVQSGKLAVVEDLTFDVPRTKDAVALLSALELGGHVLVVLPEPHPETELSFRNLERVKIDYPRNLGTYDLLFADHVLFTVAALDRMAGADAPAPPSPESPEKRTGRAKKPAATAGDESGQDKEPS